MFKRIGISAIVVLILLTAVFAGAHAAPTGAVTQSTASGMDLPFDGYDTGARCYPAGGGGVNTVCCTRTANGGWDCWALEP